MKTSKNLLAAAAVSLSTIFLASPSQAGIFCLAMPNTCESSWILYTPQLYDAYDAIRNRVTTASCPYGTSSSGTYTFYGHGLNPDTNAIEQNATTNNSCLGCQLDSLFSTSLDGYPGVCAPRYAADWAWASQFCGFATGLTLEVAAAYFIECPAQNPRSLPGTYSACSATYGCLKM